MEVILLENIEGLGRKGDRVKVRPGYGRNHLLPHRRALPATPDVLSRLETMKKNFATEEAKIVTELKGVAGRLEGHTLQLTMRATAEGHLFGSVSAQVIAAALKEKGFEVSERDIRLKEPIKAVGTFPIAIHLHADVQVAITVIVDAEGATAAPAPDAATATPAGPTTEPPAAATKA